MEKSTKRDESGIVAEQFDKNCNKMTVIFLKLKVSSLKGMFQLTSEGNGNLKKFKKDNGYDMYYKSGWK